MTNQVRYAELLSALDPESELPFPRRLPGRRPPIPPRPPGRPRRPVTPLRPRYNRALIRWVQAALNKVLGTRLTAHGILDLPTRNAIRTFQRRYRLPPSGLPNARTIAVLRRALQSPQGPGSPLKPGCIVLSGFGFDRAELTPQHRQRIAALARQMVAAGTTGVRVIGHTDPVGTDAYNLALGERRARQVAAALRQALEQVRPGYSRRLRFTVESRGEREPVRGSAAQQRRVEICYTPGPRPVAEDRTCGVPARSMLDEISLELEVEELEQETPRVAVRPHLCLFQNSSNTRHRNHFQCGASRQARRIGALAVPATGDCSRRVGATPYDTGADIIAAIERAYRCLGQPIESVHIFGHSGSVGIYGVTGREGLYRAGMSGINRAGGGRTVSDIPTAALSPNVVFVLHGCNQAAGSENFARDLYQHLAAHLANPRVFGHYNTGCASRNNSWREYSRRYPNGRNVANAAGYTDVGCCG